MSELSAADVARRRMAAQRVEPEGGARLDPADVVRHLGAVQAQDYVQSLWAIGLRSAGARVDDVEGAAATGAIARSWGMRGTLHWTPGEDATWMHALFAPRILARTTPSAWAYHAVDQALADRAATILEQALRPGPAITRAQLSGLLEQEGVPDDRQQHYFLYAHLSHTGLLRHGPRQEGRDTFVLRERGLPAQRRLDHDESVVELARRFFVSHGPASTADLANWSGLPAAEVEAAVDHLLPDLEQVEVDGHRLLAAPGVRAGSGTVLLPAYDELLIGLADRSAHFAAHGEVAIATYNGMFRATIVQDGQVVGLWRRERQKTRTRIETSMVPGLDAADLADLDGAAERYAIFHGQGVALVAGEPAPMGREQARWGKNAGR